MPTSVDTTEGKPVGRKILPPPRNWFSDRLLAPIVAIFLLVLILFFGLSTFDKTNLQKILKPETVEKQQLDLGDTSRLFAVSSSAQRFNEFIALNEPVKAFIYLSDEYNRSPANEKRDVLIKLAEYIKTNSLKNEQDLIISCREESCGAVFDYSDELNSVKNKIEENPLISESRKLSLLREIEDSALATGSGDTNRALNSLSGAFQDLRNVWRQNKAPSIRIIEEEILKLVEKTNPNYYQAGVRLGTLQLK